MVSNEKGDQTRLEHFEKTDVDCAIDDEWKGDDVIHERMTMDDVV